MKRWLLRLLAMALFLSGSGPVRPAVAISPVLVVIDGRPVRFPDVQPLIRDDRVLLPTRTLAEALGASVTWYPTTRTVYMTNIRHTAQVTVGSPHAWSVTWMFQLDVPPIIVDGRTMLPARFVAEALGASVRWDTETRTVTITSNQETRYSQADMEPAATAYITPFVSVDNQGRYRIYRPEGIWFPVHPSALRQLRNSMDTINEFVAELPRGNLAWEPANDLTWAAAEHLNLHVGGPDWDGWKEPVLTVADSRQPVTRVRVYWWLTKSYVDDDTATDIRLMLQHRATT